MVNDYSRSYAKYVTSVTSGASQGPHSFNSVFVCLCHRHAWRYPLPVLYGTIKDSQPASQPDINTVLYSIMIS